MSAGDSPCVLITIPISHYCEKARWALDYAGVRYREVAHLQVIHRYYVRRAGGGTTAPVLICGDRVWSESSQIVDHADVRAPQERRLYPADATEARHVRELERDFDQDLGPHGRRWMYDGLSGRRDLALRYACAGVPAWERRALRIGYPLVMRAIDRILDISPETARASELEVRKTFDHVAATMKDGRPYLAGERFTAADLTFAALSAPIVMPPEYSVVLPLPDELPRRVAEVVTELRDHPAGRHALRMFKEHRH